MVARKYNDSWSYRRYVGLYPRRAEGVTPYELLPDVGVGDDGNRPLLLHKRSELVQQSVLKPQRL